MNKRLSYYYRIAIATEVGKELKAFNDKCAEVAEIARQWAEKQGATSYIESSQGMAGGIDALEFENTLSKKGWERLEAPNGDVFWLPDEGSKLETEMYALPIVSETELIRILKFKARVNSKGQKMPMTFGNTTPMVFAHHGYWYVDMPYECECEGAEVIDEKEFYRRRLAAVNEK